MRTDEELYRVRAAAIVSFRFTEVVEVDDPTDMDEIWRAAMEKHGLPTWQDEIAERDVESCETVYDPEEDRYWRRESAMEDRAEERRAAL